MKRLGLTNLRVPDAVLFLDVEPSTSVSRIDKRGEEKQVHETEEKLARLRQAYRLAVEVVSSEFNIPSVVVDAERPFCEVLEESMIFLRKETGAQHV